MIFDLFPMVLIFLFVFFVIGGMARRSENPVSRGIGKVIYILGIIVLALFLLGVGLLVYVIATCKFPH